MAEGQLKGLRVAILATDGSSNRSCWCRARRLTPRAPHGGRVAQGRQGPGLESQGVGRGGRVDQTLESADPEDYDALVLPGGVMNPDALRMSRRRWRS